MDTVNENNVNPFYYTPLCLIGIMFLSSITSSLLKGFRRKSLSFFFNMIFWTCLFLLNMWIYVKFSGKYQLIGKLIDTFANNLWKRVRLRKFFVNYNFICLFRFTNQCLVTF